jgi:hypothetical protein
MNTAYTGSATIYRTHPEALDPSVSSRGHECPISSPFPLAEADVLTWVATNAPEVIDASPRYVCEPGTDPGNLGLIETRKYYYLIGRDTRGYRTEVYVQVRPS